VVGDEVTRASSAAAALGFATNMTPKVEMTASKLLSSKGRSSAVAYAMRTPSRAVQKRIW